MHEYVRNTYRVSRVENTELRKLLRNSNRCNHTNNLFKDEHESANRFISSSCKGQRLSIKVRSISSSSPSYLSQQFIVAINEGREGVLRVGNNSCKGGPFSIDMISSRLSRISFTDKCICTVGTPHHHIVARSRKVEKSTQWSTT